MAASDERISLKFRSLWHHRAWDKQFLRWEASMSLIGLSRLHNQFAVRIVFPSSLLGRLASRPPRLWWWLDDCRELILILLALSRQRLSNAKACRKSLLSRISITTQSRARYSDFYAKHTTGHCMRQSVLTPYHPACQSMSRKLGTFSLIIEFHRGELMALTSFSCYPHHLLALSTVPCTVKPHVNWIMDDCW